LPVWSPDGKTILYQKEVGGEHQLFVINPDGTNKKPLTSGPGMHVAANWSRDGNFIFYRSTEGGAWAIWRMNADGSNRTKLLDGVPPVDWAFEKLAVSR
jgi:TolB protein